MSTFYPNTGEKRQSRTRSGSATYRTKFSMRWKQKYPFICEVKESLHLYQCTICDKVLSCSHQGLADVKRHITSRGHVERMCRMENSKPKAHPSKKSGVYYLLNESNHSSDCKTKERRNDNGDKDDSEMRNYKENGTRDKEDGETKSGQIKKRENYLQWQDYFMAVAFLSAMRSKDPNSQVGACIVNSENKIVGIGYNGMPNRCSDDDLPWGREGNNPLDTKYMYVCHAEMNAIMNKNASEIKGSTIYVALFPCNECAKLIIQAGIKEVVYLSDKYRSDPKMVASRRLLAMAGVICRQHVPTESKIVIDFEALSNCGVN